MDEWTDGWAHHENWIWVSKTTDSLYIGLRNYSVCDVRSLALFCFLARVMFLLIVQTVVCWCVVRKRPWLIVRYTYSSFVKGRITIGQ